MNEAYLGRGRKKGIWGRGGEGGEGVLSRGRLIGMTRYDRFEGMGCVLLVVRFVSGAF